MTITHPETWLCPNCEQATDENAWRWSEPIGGGPFSGPMDGAEPPEYMVECPKCGKWCEPEEAVEVEPQESDV